MFLLSHSINQILRFPSFVYSSTVRECKRNLTVDSELRVSRMFRNRREGSYLKGRVKVTMEKNCLILYFYSDKLNLYKTYDFKKFLIPDAFKYVWLQNTFNRCKVHQILHPTVDYACFLVKCINYQNVMCSKIIHFLQEKQLAKFLQEMKKCCKIVARILQDVFFTRMLQKLCIDCENFARFLQKLFFLWTRVL